jgi:colanic acid/amylovoran biosynthesis glycosyltransferase
VEGKRPSLVVVSALGTVARGEGRFVITKKFTEAMTFYADAWDGPVIAFMPVAERGSDNLDNVEVDAKTLPFEVRTISPQDPGQLARDLRGAGVVLGGPFWWLRGLSRLCAQVGVPSVYNTEYSLLTRVQIVLANPASRLRHLRRSLWELNEELRHYRREIALADGVQCNGTPTYDAYRGLTPSPLLYFDTRVFEGEVATDDALARGNARRLGREPLRLAFSGRLNAMKGAGDLVEVAAELDRRGMPFKMDIYGDGPLAATMRDDLARRRLDDRVKLGGVLDFHSELLPTMRDDVDLFVCCHPQGDPSCTYLETMSAGVPIVGYANDAFAGLMRERPVGWSVPRGDARRMADEIARIAENRPALAERASASLTFARLHTFEQTFRRRIDHLAAIAARGARPAAAAARA